MEIIRKHTDLKVYLLSFETAMTIFDITKSFPKEEIYSLTDQVRRSSRSVSSNIAEAWRKRKYPKAFILKLSDAEAEAAETQVWLDFALKCGYLSKEAHEQIYDKYDHIIAMIINMITKPENWNLKG